MIGFNYPFPNFLTLENLKEDFFLKNKLVGKKKERSLPKKDPERQKKKIKHR